MRYVDSRINLHTSTRNVNAVVLPLLLRCCLAVSLHTSGWDQAMRASSRVYIANTRLLLLAGVHRHHFTAEGVLDLRSVGLQV
jgi:hypothetical protein